MDYREPTTGEALAYAAPGARFVIVGERLDEWLGPGVRPSAGAVAAAKRALSTARIIAAGDAAITAVRASVFTADPAQAAIYQEKEHEAKAYVAAGYPLPVDPALYPILALEAVARDLAPAAQADAVIGKAAIWRLIAAASEAARLNLKSIDQPVPIEGGERLATAAELSATATALVDGVIVLAVAA